MANSTVKEPEKFKIVIDTILGGASQSGEVYGPGQFFSSINIDPGQPAYDSDGIRASGLLRPVPTKAVSNNVFTDYPIWATRTPKTGSIWVYDASGSVYQQVSFSNAPIGHTDLNDGGSSSGNGMAYYDNFLYCARDTTIARYGPLNSATTPAWADDYWVTTLGMTALGEKPSSFPADYWMGQQYPDHLMVRHSDGALYIADTVGNQGTLHKIQTSKTTYEGDTNNGSKYNVLQVGYGLYITAMESYGQYIALGFFESYETYNQGMHAKFALWDTTSDKVNLIAWTEFPDPVITSIVNKNGILYIFSGCFGDAGARITRYVGGTTFEEVARLQHCPPPWPDAVDVDSERIMFGTVTVDNSFGNGGGVVSLGTQDTSLGHGEFMIMGCSNSQAIVTSMIRQATGFSFDHPHTYWSNGSTGTGNSGTDTQGGAGDYGQTNTEWISRKYRMDRPFKITKISIPLYQPLASNMSIIPHIFTDDGLRTGSNNTKLTEISASNFPTGSNVITYRPDGLTGESNLQIMLDWRIGGTNLLTVSLPIVIEGEYRDR